MCRPPSLGSLALWLGVLAAAPALAQTPAPRPVPQPRPSPEALRERAVVRAVPLDPWAVVPSVAYVSIRLACPRYGVEVTTDIPAGWVASFEALTPSGPSATVVRRVGNAPGQLVCEYGQPGVFFVHRPPPPDAPVCRPARGGFECRPAGPFINTRGEMTVRPSQRFDLDDPGRAARHDDFWLRSDRPAVQFLDSDTNEGAPRPRLVRVDGPRGPAECSAALEAGAVAAYPLGELPPGTRVCYRTKSGLVGQLTVLRHEGSPPHAVSIRYTTWVQQ